MATSIVQPRRRRALSILEHGEALRIGLPSVALIAMLGLIFWQQPFAMSYFGLTIMLNYGVPIIFAALAQMCIIAASDIDLGIGPFIGMVSCVAVTSLESSPLQGVGVLLLSVMAYMAMGALIHVRRLPSIVITLGASFVWLGMALQFLPSPGGTAPAWLVAVMTWKPPFLPMPVLVAILAALLGHVLITRGSYGVVLRGLGGHPAAVRRAGWSLMRARTTLYGLAGVFGVLAGLSLAGLTTSGDATVGAQYTLVSIAAVIVGGGEFFGGIVSPVGTVIGALIMLLTGALMSFFNVSTDWQLAVQGTILILVLATRALGGKKS